MIDVITYAIQQELNALMQGQPCTIMEKSDFLTKSMPTYQMPFILWEEEGEGDTEQMLGGATLCTYDIMLNVYTYDPDLYGSSPSTIPAQTKALLDTIRQHFSAFTVWLSAEMQAAVGTSIGLSWTLSGVHKAPALEHPDGLCKGHQLRFSTTSWDDQTSESPVSNDRAFVSLSQTGPPISGNPGS